MYVGFSTFGGNIFRGLQIGEPKMLFYTICLRHSFGDLRHIQLSTDAWPCYSSMDIVYCTYSILGHSHRRSRAIS